MKRATAVVACLALLTWGAGRAGADVVVYSQTSTFPSMMNGNGITSFNDTTPINMGGTGSMIAAADNFTIAAPPASFPITSVQWTGGFAAPAVNQNSMTTFTLTFYSNNPANHTPLTALSSFTVAANNANPVQVGTEGPGFPGGSSKLIFNYSAPVTSAFTAMAGVQYWLSIVANIPFGSSPTFPAWVWQTAFTTPGDGKGNVGDNRSVQSTDGGLTWTNVFTPSNPPNFPFNDLAFTLNIAGVPEPSTLILWSLAGVVFVGCRWGRRRKLAIGAS